MYIRYVSGQVLPFEICESNNVSNRIFLTMIIENLGPSVPGPMKRRRLVSMGHYNDVIMSAMAPHITILTIVYSTVYSRRRSKKTSKLRTTGLCAGNSPVTGEFLAQRASNAENVSIWWRHRESHFGHKTVAGLPMLVRWHFCVESKAGFLVSFYFLS